MMRYLGIWLAGQQNLLNRNDRSSQFSEKPIGAISEHLTAILECVFKMLINIKAAL